MSGYQGSVGTTLGMETSRVLLDTYVYNSTAPWADCKEEWAFVNWFDTVFLPVTFTPEIQRNQQHLPI